MTKKLKIIGPYTPEHPGPFCTRDGRPVRVVCTDRTDRYPIVALVRSNDGSEEVMSFHANGRYNTAVNSICDMDLMNAEEAPVAREFWVNEYEDGMRFGNLQTSLERAAMHHREDGYIRTIHVREVLPGDAE